MRYKLSTMKNKLVTICVISCVFFIILYLYNNSFDLHKVKEGNVKNPNQFISTVSRESPKVEKYPNQFLSTTVNKESPKVFSTKNLDSRQLEILSEAKLFETLMKNCSASVSRYRIDVDGQILTMDDYKKYQAKKFIKNTANPFPKRKTPPRLEKFGEDNLPDPYSRLKHARVPLDYEAIKKTLQQEKDRRLKLGDEDILKIKEVQEELQNTTYRVPNLVHFIWFGCNKFYLLNYLCVLSAFRYQKPKLILYHTDCEPNGEYWTTLKLILKDKLRVVKRSPPEQVWGIPIKVVEHRADVARLHIELEVGGIYIDADTFVLRPSEELRIHDMVLAEQNKDGISNSIILANRTSFFLRRWYWEYKNFIDRDWNFNSIKVTWALARVFPDTIFVSKEQLCRPNGAEINFVYHELYDWRKNYMMHVYARYKLKSDGKGERDLKELAILNTTYGQMSRHILWGDEKSRDISDWIVTCNKTRVLLNAMN